MGHDILSEVYNAAKSQKQQSLIVLSDFCRAGLATAPLDERRNTVLHFIAIYGNAVAIKKLLREGLLTIDELKKGNANGETTLHEAVRYGRMEVVQPLIEKETSLIFERNKSGETPLYLAAAHGNSKIFYFLCEKFPREFVMSRRGQDGYTVLHAAVFAEHYGFAVRILEAYPELANTRDQTGVTALCLLASKRASFISGTPYSFKNVGICPFVPWQLWLIFQFLLMPGKTLMTRADRDVENPSDMGPCISKSISACWCWVSNLVTVAGYRRFVRARVSVLVNGSPTEEFQPQKELRQGDPLSHFLFIIAAEALNLLLARAVEKGLFRGASVGSNDLRISHLQFADDTIVLCEGGQEEVINIKRVLRSVFPWLRALDDVKQKHMYALELGKGLLEEQKTWNQPFYWEDLLASEVKVNKEPNPLGEAIKHGILELVKIILKKFPEASNSFDKNGRNIIHMAVEYKHILIYEHLKKHVDHKEKMYDVDSDGNTILHVAATSENVPKFLVGQVLSMAWDLFWFKQFRKDAIAITNQMDVILHVKDDFCPELLPHQNSENLTAKELFEENHKEVIEKAEKEAKDMNNGLMVLSILISTINFAAIFTVPGGFNGETGKPAFFKNRNSEKFEELHYFLIYVGGSLIASLLALGTQLSIQLSRFRSYDFYVVLPLKYFLAMSALFYSSTMTVTTCFQAYILEEEQITTPYIIFFFCACFPATLVYVDIVYMSVNYLCFVARYSLVYKGHEM
ncbi:unnamed protein product [Camellia sinensis]